MDGGLGPGELGVVVATFHVGKTWILTAIGAEAVRKGFECGTLHNGIIRAPCWYQI